VGRDNRTQLLSLFRGEFRRSSAFRHRCCLPVRSRWQYALFCKHPLRSPP
jgi:hypothetical protein